VKNHYDLLGVRPDASPDEIKKAFRHEIARYHPDKVQHLGREFQDMAAVRAAELTEAYRVLLNEAERAAYDEQVAAGRAPRAPEPAARPQAAQPPAPEAPPSVESPQPEPAGEWKTIQQERQSSEDFVRREALRRIRHAIGESISSIETLGLDGFELSYACRTRRSLFKKAAPDLYVLVHYVHRVDSTVIAELWPFAAQFAVRPEATVCVFLLGPAVSPRPELAAAITEQRKHTKSRGPLVFVPLDVHDWDAHVPSNAPPAVKSVLQRLRQVS
jgi:curved DNA-binding protein CbpA